LQRPPLAAWEEQRDAPEFRLLENEIASIKDYVIDYGIKHAKPLSGSQPYIVRCHHLPAEHAVTAGQIDQFVRFANANGWEAGGYSTTGLFTAGALLRAMQPGPGFEVSTSDSWHVAFGLIPDLHSHVMGKDFIALSQQPGWPKKVLEATERRGLLRRLFG
jgi:hypothetical protein